MKSNSSKKQEKESQVLVGLIELFIKNGKPIGSNTLKESGFEHLSSATIRNYFFKLEEQGFLSQQHASGGRIPTDLAYKFYIEQPTEKPPLSKQRKKEIEKEFSYQDKQIITYFNKVIEKLSDETGCAALISTPRFDQDFISDVKLLSLDPSRILCILITSFGMVNTQILYLPSKVSSFSLKRIETYFTFKRTSLDMPTLDAEEQLLADHLYSEILLRQIVGHATFTKDDLYKTGFTKLLHYEELQDTGALANTLSLFENPILMQKLCQETTSQSEIKTWIGEDLASYHLGCKDCSILMVPYKIRDKNVGAIGLLGPKRIPYKFLFEILKGVSKVVSDTLTSLLFKYQMSYRLPQTSGIDFKENKNETNPTSLLLIDVENKQQTI